MAKTPPKAPPEALLQLATRRGIERPERFSANELEALLQALPADADSPLPSAPSSGAGLHAPALEALSDAPKDAPPAPGYQENPFYKEPPVTMPALLGQDAVWLLAVEPEVLFCTWDISDRTRARAGAGGKPTLRLVSPDAAGHVDVEIDFRADGWYVASSWERVRVTALLGVTEQGRFEQVANSRAVMIPPRTAAPVRRTFMAHIPYDLDRRMIPNRSVVAWARGEPLAELPQVTLMPGETPQDVAARLTQDGHGNVPQDLAEGLPPAPGAPPVRGTGPAVTEAATRRFHELVTHGLRTWEWRMGGPNSSDLMMRGQEEWMRYVQLWLEEAGKPKGGLPSSVTLPSSGRVPSSGALAQRAAPGKG